MKSNHLLPLLASLPSIHAWGTLGHTTVALIATSLVAPDTKTFFQSILHNTSSLYLADVATWADSYRYTEAGRFSGALHYIDAEDNPPDSCEVVFKRDCSEKGCVVKAIGNYTAQLLNNTLPAEQRNMAAKFIIHFLGDIHQPLHAEHLNIGGNTIRVIFDSVPTNLHKVWDDFIPEKLVGGYALPFSLQWAANLTTEIQSGKFKSVAAKWLEGINLADPEGSALVWAKQSNELVCTTVLKAGVQGVSGQELGGAYYEGAVDAVQTQVAKAGLRLAKWMDLIAAKLKADSEYGEDARQDL